MRSLAFYAVIVITIVALVGWLLTMAFPGPRDVTAIWLSAIVVVVVQLAAFGMTKLLAPKGMFVGWGAGSLLRLATLIIYSLMVVKVLGMPAVPALISMVVFFFLSTLIEPLLLRQ
jgi:hypothetical protein